MAGRTRFAQSTAVSPRESTLTVSPVRLRREKNGKRETAGPSVIVVGTRLNASILPPESRRNMEAFRQMSRQNPLIELKRAL